MITDLQMPEMDGYAFARAIRAEQDQAKQRKPMVVAFTANTQSEALGQCMDAGMDDYLTKPAELASLRAKLTQWLGSDASLKTAPPGTRAVGAPAANAIDRARIQQLAGGPEGIAEVLAQLESGVRSDIAALQVALESANCAALRSAAHRIKGSALTIGARPPGGAGRSCRGRRGGHRTATAHEQCARASRRPGARSRLRARPAQRTVLLDDLDVQRAFRRLPHRAGDRRVTVGPRHDLAQNIR